jgi:hypothetical protein
MATFRDAGSCDAGRQFALADPQQLADVVRR